MSDSTNNVDHLHTRGMDRERDAIRCWLSVFGEELRSALGLSKPFWASQGLNTPWWCILNAKRADVFADDSQGDVDLVAGPLTFRIPEDEWHHRLEQEAKDLPESTHPSRLVHYATLRACEEGLIEWPPRMEFLVACEAKASWFDAAVGTWKATHVNEARRINGQLSYLRERGVERIGFFHIGVTKPQLTDISPFFQAIIDGQRASETFPCVLDDTALPYCGYFRTVIAAVPDRPEELAGGGGSLEIVRSARADVGTERTPQVWRTDLRERLGQLNSPLWPNVFIDVCPECNRWNVTGLLNHLCVCTRIQ